MYFYHPDHLGSSSYITDIEGRITQHTEYIAFGEVLFEEHSTSRTMPYLFNGKELDSETNLTYFGARYLDMKTSLWLNTDPLSGYNPIQETEHYIDGQHNGGVFNPMNHNTYGYTYNNPVIYIDPNGKQTYFDAGALIQQRLNSTVYTLKQKVIDKYNGVKQVFVDTGKNIQNWVKNNKKEILGFAKEMQEQGDNATKIGLGAAAVGVAFEGIGATPGLAYAGAGTLTSSIGDGIEITVELITQDFSNNATGKAIYNKTVSKIIDKAVDKAIPGPTPSIQKPIEKTLNEMRKVEKEIIKETVTKQLEAK